MKRNFIILVLLSLVAVGCGKKWKKPVMVDVKFESPAIQGNSQGVAHSLDFLAGHFRMVEFNVLGQRKQGESIDFTSTNKTKFNFNSASSDEVLNIDIPQGTYTNMDVLLEIGQGNNTNAIKVEAQYTDNNLNQFLVRFELDVTYVYRLKGKEKSGETDIVLVSGSDREMFVSVDLDYWFDAITPAMWDAADHVSGQVNSPVMINENDNPELYSSIVNRIGDGMRAEFR